MPFATRPQISLLSLPPCCSLAEFPQFETSGTEDFDGTSTFGFGPLVTVLSKVCSCSGQIGLKMNTFLSVVSLFKI